MTFTRAPYTSDGHEIQVCFLAACVALAQIPHPATEVLPSNLQRILHI